MVRLIRSTGQVALALTFLSVAACSTESGGTSVLSPSGATANGKPGTSVAATITFADRTGDAITSDGGGSYPPAAGCQLLSGNQLGCGLPGSGRSLNYNLNNLISGQGPTGTLTDATRFSVTGLSGMAIGATIQTRAIFQTAIGEINFDSTMDAQTNSAVVTRVSATSWTVNTSAGDVGVLVQNETVPDPKNPHKTIIITHKTYYHLPFQYTGSTQ